MGAYSARKRCYANALKLRRRISTGRARLLQPAKSLDCFSGLFLREAQLVKALQVQPDFRARATEVGEAQGCVAGNGALTVENLGDSVSRDIDLACEFGRAAIERFEFLGQMLARMNRGHCKGLFPSGNQQSRGARGRMMFQAT